MLEEEFEEKANESTLFPIVAIALLVLLMGAGIVIWRTQTATSTSLGPDSTNKYGYASSPYRNGSGSCDGSCGSSSSVAGAGSCCPGSGSGTEGVSGKENGKLLKKAEKAGLQYYKDKYGDADVNAKATDYGCHLQVDISKDGKVVSSLGYNSTSGIYEID
jgi:hypothetical protein